MARSKMTPERIQRLAAKAKADFINEHFPDDESVLEYARQAMQEAVDREVASHCGLEKSDWAGWRVRYNSALDRAIGEMAAGTLRDWLPEHLPPLGGLTKGQQKEIRRAYAGKLEDHARRLAEEIGEAEAEALVRSVLAENMP